MITAGDACRWCTRGMPIRRAYGAKARWVVDDPRSDDLTTLVECPECTLVYFTADFTNSELAHMYDGYRGDGYFSRRHRYEPWYTAKVNNAIGHSAQVLEHRRKHLEELVGEAIRSGAISSPSRVLDVGGDEGQFIPEIPTITARAVLEVSGAKPVDGVTTIQTWQEVSQFGPDLIMMCHVLEHTSSARHMISDTAANLGPGGLLYLEIPLDRPARTPRAMAQPWYAAYTRAISRHPGLFRMADLTSLVSRRFFGRPIVGSVMKQNEHINFFDELSLHAVVSDFGFRKVSASVYKPSSGVPILDVRALGVLYQRI